MQTAREALIAQGLAKPTRGKFSNDAKAWLAAQVAEGVKFSDWPKGETVKATDNSEEGKPTVKTDPAKSARESEYLAQEDYRFPEAEYKAVAKVGGKIYGMREACSNCGVSLVMCGCLNPTLYGKVLVSIVPKKG